MNFSRVAETFETIEPIQARLAITRILGDLLGAATPIEAGIIATLSLGELRPAYKNIPFAIAEKNAIRAVAQFLGEPTDEIVIAMKEAGDLGSVLGARSWNPAASLSVEQVYERLERIALLHGTGSQDSKIQSLSLLFRDLDQLSAKYCLRIIMGKLRLGFSDMTILDALSWMHVGDKSLHAQLEQAYNVCADIGIIATTLKSSGLPAIETMGIHIGVPVRPAAAERLPTAAAIIEKLGPCVAEPKIDGFRLQVHIKHTGTATPIVAFFSRNLQNMSPMFPELTEACLHLPVSSIIAEGEAIAYDPNTDNFLPFQETVKRRRKHDIASIMEEFPLQLFLFDILYLDGESMLNMPFRERRKILQAILAKTRSNHVRCIQEIAVTTAKQLEVYFNATITDGLEGVVVKRPDTAYTPGKRNFNWIKLKRIEHGHLDDTIDCVVLGYYVGEGKRSGFGLGAFLVGVYDKSQDMFVTIAKIGTGMTDIEWVALKKRCDTLAVPQRPKNVQCAEALAPDVWTVPEIMCVIRADEITRSPLHTAGKQGDQPGYALRFPRFITYRDDKSATEATTVDEIIAMYALMNKRPA